MRRLGNLLAATALLLAAANAGAIPVLQIYIEGAIYDAETETWVTSSPDFKLWVVGDVDAKGTISDVTLTASFFGLGAGSISFTPTTTSLITDPSTPGPLSLLGSGTSHHPTLPDHGIFNDVTLHHWNDYLIGNMASTDSPIGDYDGSATFPSAFPDNGQVNVYQVHVEGWNKVHFDAYGTTVGRNGRETSWKTPFSHDGQVPVTSSTWSAVKTLFAR